MRSRKSLYNLIAAIFLQITNLVIGIFLPRVMVLSFGSEINGLVTSIRQFISYLSLMEAGIAGASIYALYKPIEEKNYTKILRILNQTREFYIKSGLFFSVLTLILAFIYPYIISTDKLDYLSIVVLVFILGFNGSLEFFTMGKYRVLLTADQKSYILSVVQSLSQVLNFIVIYYLASNGYNIVIVQTFATSSYILRSILLKDYVKKNYSYIVFKKAQDKSKLEQRWDVLVHQIAGIIVFSSPIFLITIFCTLTDVSIFSIYNMIFAGISGILGIFNSGLVAGVGSLIASNNYIKLRKLYNEYECSYYMLITWVYSCTYILVIPLIQIYTKGMNDANYIRTDLATLFIFIGILNSLRTPQSTFVNAAGHFKQTRIKAIIEVCINVFFSIVFINIYGMPGVLFGSVISYLYRTLDFIIYVPIRITKISLMKTLHRILRLSLLFTVVVSIKYFINLREVINLIDWFKMAVIVSIWSISVILSGNILMDYQTIKDLKSRLVKLL